MKKSRNLIKVAFYFLLLVLVVMPLQALAGDDTGQKVKHGRWQIEVFAGLDMLDPGINDLARADDSYREFFYDKYYPYMRIYDSLNFWNAESKGEYGKITSIFSQGIRLKYRVSPNLSISLGFQTGSVNKNSQPSYQYAWTEYNGTPFMDNRDYFQYRLSVSTYSPQLGIHYQKKIGKKMELEGFIAGGPAFGECSYLSDWQSGFYYRGGSLDFLLYQDQGYLEMNGEGSGLALEGGLRMNLPLGGKFGLFLEGVYSYTKLTGFSGSGREVRNGIEQTWQGEWAIKIEEIVTPWGEMKLEYPTNYWPEQEEDKRAGDFSLDTSGLRLRAGLFFRF